MTRTNPVRRIRIGAVLAALIALSSVHASEPYEHEISFEQRHLQYVSIVSRFELPEGATDLVMANWIPGSYKIRDFARNVEGLVATGPRGQVLEVDRVAKNRWRVELNEAGKITIAYRVYAAVRSVRESWVDDRYALINPAGIFVRPDGEDHRPHQLTFKLPADWASVVTSMPAGNGPNRFQSEDYDQLVDSPIGVGNPDQVAFTVAGKGHRLVNFGGSDAWDFERSVRDLEAMIAEQIRFWGNAPFRDDYLFINVLNEGGGGLEHKNSTILMADRWQTQEREGYVKWLTLAAHEYFHVWNVKRLRPVELGPFNYEEETYTDSLWVAEGITNYYEAIFLSQAGVISIEESLGLLAEYIFNVESKPGRLVQSVTAASRDAWIKLYQPDANSSNSTMSYYQKGAVLGFVIDARIRAATRNRRSLDDVMRLAYERYSGETGYTADQFNGLISEVAGENLSDWLNRLTNTTHEVSLDSALDYFGLELDRNPVVSAAREAGLPPPGDLGVVLDDVTKDGVIKEVLHGRPAAAAGILPGDELLAIDGLRSGFDALPGQLAQLREGQQVTVLVARDKSIREYTVTVGQARPTEFKLSVKENLPRSRRRNLEAWLGQPLD